MGAFADAVSQQQGSNPQNAGAFSRLAAKHSDPFHGIKHLARHAAQNFGNLAHYVNQNPLAYGVTSILGATSRLGEGAVSAGLDLVTGHKPTTNPVANLIDPEHELRVTHKLEHQELDKPLAALNAHLPEWARGRMPDKNDGLRQGILDFVTQTVHDPATYIPLVDVFTIGSRLARAAHVGEGLGAFAKAASKIVPSSVRNAVSERVEHAKSNLSTSHDTLKGLTQPALNIVRAGEGQVRHEHENLLNDYIPKIEQHKQGIEDLDQSLRGLGYSGTDLINPHKYLQLPLDQRLTLHKANKITDTALWRDATTEVRRSMLARGYKPSPAEQGLPVLNLVDRDFGRRYLPEQKLYNEADQKAANEAKGFSYSKGGVKRSAFDKSKTGVNSNDPLFDRFVGRLENSAYLQSKRRVEQQVMKELGFAPSNLPRTGDRIAHLQELEDNLKFQVLHERNQIGPSVALKGLSEVNRRKAMYQALAQRQYEQLVKNKELRDKYIVPGASTSDDSVSGVFSSERTAQQRAARDLKAMGQDPKGAFDENGRLKGEQSTGVLSERNKNQSSAANRAFYNLSHAQNIANATKSSIDKAIDRTKKISEQDRNQSYNVLNRADIALAKKLKNVDELSNSQKVGYARSGGGILDNFDNETQRVLNKKGENIRGAIDPIFSELLSKRPTKNLIDRLESLRSGRGNAISPVVSSVDRNRDIMNTLYNRALKTQDKHAQLKKINESIAAITKRVESDQAFKGNLQLPEVLQNRLFGEKVHQAPGVAGRLAQDAAGVLFTNPLPHLGGNIFEQQAFAGSGPLGLVKGLIEAAKLARQHSKAIERLNAAKSVGATHEKGYEAEEAAKSIPGKIYQGIQRALTLGHEGQASVAFQDNIRKGLTPADAAEEVRKTFGRPYESSKEAQKFKAAGSQFADWVMSTVPRSTKKALGSAAGRKNLNLYARSVQDANRDIFEPEYGVEYNPGGFASRAASLALRPLSYLASQSLDNVLHGTATNAKTYPMDVLKEAIPLAGPMVDLFSQPLKPKQRLMNNYKPLPAWAKALTLTGGYFTHAETPRQKLLREMLELRNR